MEHIAEKLCLPFSHALAIFVCDTGFHSSSTEPACRRDRDQANLYLDPI